MMIFACLPACFVDNNSDYSMVTWAPIYFTEVLGVSQAGVGKYLVIPTVLNMGGTFLFGSIEALVLRNKILTEHGVRRWSSVLGTTCSAGGLAVFALCPGPLSAALAYSAVALGQGLHHSGFLPNYLEVGGKVSTSTNCCFVASGQQAKRAARAIRNKCDTPRLTRVRLLHRCM
jgi:hypothetical protein|eukprot:COSAG06_NODE_7812_length_2365_cov_3.324360_3_plen_174_part_00